MVVVVVVVEGGREGGRSLLFNLTDLKRYWPRRRVAAAQQNERRRRGKETWHDHAMQWCKYFVFIWSHIWSNVSKQGFLVHPQEDLANYGPTMKVENLKNHFIFWLLWLEPFVKIWWFLIFFSFEIWQIRVPFHQNPLFVLKLYFPSWKKWKFPHKINK